MAPPPVAPSSKKPIDSDFYQQRLKAWQPILTPKWVVVTFLTIGIPFVIIGFLLKNASDAVIEHRVQYDGDGSDAAAAACKTSVNGTPTTCVINITVNTRMVAPVYVYYELQNFYQNHRRYVKSRNDNQLLGTVYTSTSDSSLSSCDPLASLNGKVLHPCGLIAMSFFNDTYVVATPGVSMSESGIAWSTDKNKFSQVSASTRAQYNNSVLFIEDIYPQLGASGGPANEHFIVWMRVAALPSFRKLYGHIDKDIPAGTVLSFQVQSNFPVSTFSGKKALVVSTVSALGGKNPFLGIAYIVVGFVCIVLAVLFAIRSRCGGRKLGDTSFLVWAARR